MKQKMMSGMKSFERFKKKVDKNKEHREEGKYNCIPLPFDRLGSMFPGIQQGKYNICTANSGIGKTILTKFLYVFWPYVWCKDNLDSGITFKCKYFALEESEDEFIASVYSFFLNYYFSIKADPDHLLSMHKDTILDDYTREYMDKLDDIVDEFLKDVEIIDSVYNPTGIYNNVKEYSRANGTHYYYNYKEDRDKKNCITEEELRALGVTENWAYAYYKPDRPDEYFTVVIDHFSLLQVEAGAETLHKAMSRMSADYGRKNITKHWNYIFVNVQQQNSKSEEKQFDNKGNNVIAKLRPSLSELANNTETQRDCLVAWGLFAPDRYEVPKYLGYDILKLKDNFRELVLLKNRGGRSNLISPLYFDGATFNFKELPKITSDGMSKYIGDVHEDKWYEEFKKNKEFFFNPSQKNLFHT